MRSDSVEAADVERSGRGSAHRPFAVFIAAIAACAVCFSVLPGDDLTGSLAQGCVLAAIAIVGVLLTDARAMRSPGTHDGAASGGEEADGCELCGTSSDRGSAKRGRTLGKWMAYGLAVGLIAGFAGWILAGAPDAAIGAAVSSIAARGAFVVAICVLTGVFEEGVFRVLALDALAPQFGGGGEGLLKAAVWSSVLFGLVHAGFGEAASLGGAVAWAQALVKPLQAALFGFFMAALFVRTRSLWVVAGAHGLFDVACLGPVMLVEGAPQPYVTGSVADLALLVLVTVLLVPPAVVAFRSFWGNGSDA